MTLSCERPWWAPWRMDRNRLWTQNTQQCGKHVAFSAWASKGGTIDHGTTARRARMVQHGDTDAPVCEVAPQPMCICMEPHTLNQQKPSVWLHLLCSRVKNAILLVHFCTSTCAHTTNARMMAHKHNATGNTNMQTQCYPQRCKHTSTDTHLSQFGDSSQVHQIKVCLCHRNSTDLLNVVQRPAPAGEEDKVRWGK